MNQLVALEVLDQRYALAQLPAGTPCPPPPAEAEFWSMTVTRAEISIVCVEDAVPNLDGMSVERAWRGLAVIGPLPFELKGILAGLLTLLADAGIGVFTLSTYNTDYIFVKEFDLEATVEALRRGGHDISYRNGSAAI